MQLLDARHLIDGHWQPSADGRTAASADPATGEAIGTLADGGRAEAQAAIAAARRAFDTTPWAQSPRVRQNVLLQWADRLERRADLAALLTRENGKVLREARGEMAGAISEIRYYAGWRATCPDISWKWSRGPTRPRCASRPAWRGSSFPGTPRPCC